MRGDDGFHNRRADPAAFAFSLSGRIHPVKAVEQPGQMRLRDRLAGVGNDQFARIFLFAYRHGHRFSVRRIAQGIGEQVIDGSPEHLRIAVYQAGRAVKTQRDMAFFRRASKKSKTFITSALKSKVTLSGIS